MVVSPKHRINDLSVDYAAADGVRISGTEGMILKSRQPGSFAVELREVDSPFASEDKMLRRIMFTPSELKGCVSLGFALQKE
jgi:hypothetical protein